MIHDERQFQSIINEIVNNGGTPYFVGGYVRDLLMKLPESNDIDIEVFGLTIEQIENIIDAETTGEKFPVWRMYIGKYDVQFSLPRTERAITVSKNDFEITVNPFMSVVEAAKRRDTTINAIYQNCVTLEILDPFNGREAIKNRIINPISEHFLEDPTRVLRIFRQCSQFGFTPSQLAVTYGKRLHPFYHTIEPYLIAQEWLKWSKTRFPGRGLQYLQNCGWLEFYPSLYKLQFVEQNPKFHPEGNVWNHVKKVVVWAGHFRMINDTFQSILTFSALFHDIGKIVSTEIIDGEIHSYKHEIVGSEMIENAFKEIHPNFFQTFVKPVELLTKYHMLFHNMSSINRRNVMKLISIMGVDLFSILMSLNYCDLYGRKLTEQMEDDNFKLEQMLHSTFLEALESCNTKEIERIVTGKLMIKLGFTPSKEFGKILQDALDAQIEGFLTKETLPIWIEDYFD